VVWPLLKELVSRIRSYSFINIVTNLIFLRGAPNKNICIWVARCCKIRKCIINSLEGIEIVYTKKLQYIIKYKTIEVPLNFIEQYVLDISSLFQ
jgi:hypothetical protein